MSNETSQAICTILSLEEYKFKLEDVNEPSGFVEYKGKMEVSYDGEFLGIDTWEIPIDQDFTDSSVQQVTLVGPDQANLLAGAILALLESYNQNTLFDDKDIQEEYKKMAEETKNARAEEAVEQSED